jgi:hypothetical protein
MDIVLRARHDSLVSEFSCTATQLRIVRTPAGSHHTRDIQAFCNEPRAEKFGGVLADYTSCCAACLYLARRVIEEEDYQPSAELLDVEDLPA